MNILQMTGSVLPYVVAYADTDAGGVVYHARYVEMAERGRNHLLNAIGMTFEGLERDLDTVLVVHRITATYKAPARLGDKLMLASSLLKATSARSRWGTVVCRDDTLLATVEAEVVAVSASNRQLRMYPEELTARFAHFIGPAMLGARTKTQKATKSEKGR